MKLERTICSYCGSIVIKNNYCTQCGERLSQKNLEYTVEECTDMEPVVKECMDIEPVVESNNLNIDAMHLQLKLLLIKIHIKA